ncbi:MAG: tetratricopeptide repeat protein [Anaerolineae bacterium]|nr:tetratricopeptide repeat protein [Thermoflexales bacterium]MDW8407418.1 tetratricopeptide repeat protein [Anaerolineae bacterium]
MAQHASSAIELRARNVGELLDLTFSLYRSHFWTFAAIALVVMGPLMVLNSISSAASLAQIFLPFAMDDPLEEPMTGLLTATLGASFVSLCASGLLLLAGVFAPWMGGALTHNVIERILGRAPTWRDSYRAAQPRWAALWVAAALRTIVLYLCLIPAAVSLYVLLLAAVLGVGVLDANTVGSLVAIVGLAALCLPLVVVGIAVAVWLGVAWSLSEPAIVGEGAGATQSLRRSYRLTQGFRWRLLGRLLMFWLLQLVVVQLPLTGLQLLLFGGLASAAETGDPSFLAWIGMIGSLVFGFVSGVLVTPLNVIYATVNYLDLRVRKEQLDLHLRAARLTPSVSPAGEVNIPSPTPSPATTAWASSDVSVGQVPVEQSAAWSSDQPIDPSLPPGQRISLLYNRIRVSGPSAELLNELGLAYQQIGDLDGALDAFNRARALDPYDAGIAYNLALLHRDRNNLAEARRMMAEYLRLEPDPEERQRVLSNPRLSNVLPPQ